MTGCCAEYREKDVLAWVLGDAGGAAGQELAEHLASCPACRDRAAEYCELDASAAACRDGPVIRWRFFDSPLGRMRIAASRKGLVALSWWSASDDEFVRGLQRRWPSPVVCDCDELGDAEGQLLEYLDCCRRSFELAVDLSGLTDFQRLVLDATAQIGFGETATYAEVACAIGRPGASRAVGNALGRNPVAIVVPCHRVVRSDRTLGGYAGGLHCKEALLGIERRTPA